MATPVSDSYSVSSGSIVAGRTNNPVAASVANVGTVTTLLKDWSGSGFQLLSTIPDGLFVVNPPGHSGATWDEARQTMWFFGSETHGAAQMDNSVYRFDANTGRLHKQYTEDPRTGDFHMRLSDGVLFGDAAETRPWGFHTFANLWYDTTTKEFGVSSDNYDHSFGSTWTPPAGNMAQVANRKSPIWYYNTVTGTWRFKLSAAANTFSTNELGCGCVRIPGNGWWRVAGNSLSHLSEDAETIQDYSIFGKLTVTQYQSMPHVIKGDKFISIGGDNTGYFAVFADLGNPSGGAHRNLMESEFPALSGWTVRNMWSVKMPDDRIMFGAYKSAGEVGAFIFDWNNGSPTVTDTGHRFPALSGLSSSYYDIRASWSVKHNCALISSVRHGGHKIISVRI